MNDQTSQTTVPSSPKQSKDLAMPKATQVSNSHDARLRCVLDYQACSLEKANPLEANLGSINSGLMHIALLLEDIVVQAMQSGPPSVERLAEVSPAIDTIMRVTRQVDRFAQVELRASDASERGRANGNSEALFLDAPKSGDVGQSEDSEV